MAKDGDHEGLFRAAISESGTPFSTGSQSLDILNSSRSPHHVYLSFFPVFFHMLGLADGSGQAVYDALVRDSGCTGTPDTLECLRSTDYQKLM